ncbi:hypothetical protein AC1031_015743 [Aphanomyces cochlioides]|nr:hypothetical protein AC1031_015743 [Aphanomyces cochlioides]
MFMDDVTTNTLRPVKHAGWLRFRGPFGLWTQRFCLCKGDFLHVYKTDDIINGKLKTSIQVWRVDRLDQRWNFRVSDAHGRYMIFQSSDAALFSRWMQVLCDIAKENDEDEQDAAMVIPVSSRSLASRPSSFLDKENPALDTSTPSEVTDGQRTVDFMGKSPPRAVQHGASHGGIDVAMARRNVVHWEESFTGQVRVRSRVQVTGFLLVFLIRAAIAKP